MLDIKYNSERQWLLKDRDNVVFEILDDVSTDTLEITHYGPTECALRIVTSSASPDIAIVLNAGKIVVFNPRKYICWEHCE